MKIEQLRQMVELARTGSISAAAANLYMSQPNLSLSIRNLEEELGCSLLRRTNRGVILTAKGRDFSEYAQSVLLQFERLRAIGHTEGDGNAAVLSIACMYYRCVNLLAAELRRRHKDDPFRLNIQEYGRDGVIDCIYNGYAELGFINILSCYRQEILKQLKGKDIHFYELSTDAPVIIVGEGSPLYRMPDCETLPPDALSPYPLVRYDTMDFFHYGDKAKLVGIQSTAGEITVTSRCSLHEMLESTDAFAIVSYNEKLYRHFDYYKNIRRFSIENCKLSHVFGWIKREECTPSPLARELVNLLGEYLA